MIMPLPQVSKYGTNPNAGGTPSIGAPSGGAALISPAFPALTKGFNDFATSQIGQGATPFNASSFSPSTSSFTSPGQLTASMTPILQNLQKFFTNGDSSGVPGLGILNDLASGNTSSNPALTGLLKNGNPISAIPAWQDMVAAMQRQDSQGRANLREQFGTAGLVGGSPYGQAATDFETQSDANKNALLGQMTQQSLESAAGRQAGAAGQLNATQTQLLPQLYQGAFQLSNMLQGMDQASIQATYQEFLRTQPEYAPLLNMLFGLATTFPPAVSKTSPQSPLQGALGDIAGIASKIAIGAALA